MYEPVPLIMRRAFKWAGVVFVCGIVGYLVNGDLRWLYGAFSIAAIPVLAQLITRERHSQKDLIQSLIHI